MKKWIYLFLVIAFLLSGTGCTTEKPVIEPPAKETPIDHNKEFSVTLYYANEEYIKTGDETLDKLIPVNRVITATEDSLPLAVLQDLKKPADVQGATSEILSDLTFLGVDIKDQTAYVNLSSEKLNGGSLEEFLIINQIVYSLTELENIHNVQFLVDGSIIESLMGHFSTDKPLDRNSLK